MLTRSRRYYSRVNKFDDIVERNSTNGHDDTNFHANASETTKERSWKQENLHQLVGID